VKFSKEHVFLILTEYSYYSRDQENKAKTGERRGRVRIYGKKVILKPLVRENSKKICFATV
jgi:hypothetical protein